MATLLQVGVGSGGMVVLDLLCREAAVERIILLEPDVYKSHNVHRHYFGPKLCGTKSRPGRRVGTAVSPGTGNRPPATRFARPDSQAEIEALVESCDFGVCAVDNEPAKFHFDALMRKYRKPWTLGEVLSGGIGGWVHAFQPSEACYGCVASHLQRIDRDRQSTAAGLCEPERGPSRNNDPGEQGVD